MTRNYKDPPSDDTVPYQENEIGKINKWDGHCKVLLLLVWFCDYDALSEALNIVIIVKMCGLSWH